MAWQRTVGGISMGMSIFLGAYGSHGLSKLPHYSPILSKQWDTANKYQQLHSFALLALPSLIPPQHQLCLRLSSGLLTVGTTLFSGSVYTKVYTNEAAAGKAAPVGGVALVAGWLCIALLRR